VPRKGGLIGTLIEIGAQLGQLVETRLQLLELDFEERAKAAIGLVPYLIGLAAALFFAAAACEVYVAYVIHMYCRDLNHWSSGLSAFATFAAMLLLNATLVLVLYDALRKRLHRANLDEEED